MTTLLLVDVQRDFHPGGSLAIPSADADARRTAAFLRKHASSIDRVVMTMDSHHKLHIAHPCFWTDADGNNPNPFTLISSEDVESGKWIPRMDLKHRGAAPSGARREPLVEGEVLARGAALPENLYDAEGNLDLVAYCVEYCRRLEEKGRFQLCIWPEHCLIGSEGHNVMKEVMDAVAHWSDVTGGSVEWVHKGQNLLTEMYSALCAEVPVSEGTDFNEELFESLKEGTNQLVMCGQAMSHCVNYTVRDIVSHWPKDEMNKLTVLEDCASSVPGFEEAGSKFLDEMKAAGVNVETSESFKFGG
ncbi:hypothetical protein ACHAWF_004316 [Thalassiosira exigua]